MNIPCVLCFFLKTIHLNVDLLPSLASVACWVDRFVSTHIMVYTKTLEKKTTH